MCKLQEGYFMGEIMMSWKTFTPEELVTIRQNAYVKSATTQYDPFHCGIQGGVLETI